MRKKGEKKTSKPNFFGFPKHRFAFFLFPNVEQVRVQFFVVVIDLEECASVRIHQVFCIYLSHNTKGERLFSNHRRAELKKMENICKHLQLHL